MFNVHPQHQVSPTRPAGLRIAGFGGLGLGLSGEETPQTPAQGQQPPGQACLGGRLAGGPGVAQEATAPEKPRRPGGSLGTVGGWGPEVAVPADAIFCGASVGVEGREPETWPSRPPGTPGPPTPRPGTARLEA